VNTPGDSQRPDHFAHQALTYSEVAATAEDRMPTGYRTLQRSTLLGHGEQIRRRALEALLTWQMHRRAGLRVTADHPRAQPGSTVLLSFGAGPLRLTAPCRVVYTQTRVDHTPGR
jgi:uncharacterized protein (UPF0548 family)